MEKEIIRQQTEAKVRDCQNCSCLSPRSVMFGIIVLLLLAGLGWNSISAQNGQPANRKIISNIREPSPLIAPNLFSTASSDAVGQDHDPFIRKNGKVYFEGRELPEADSQTFTYLGYYWPYTFGKDQVHVYDGSILLPQADPKTFTYVCGIYAKDAVHVYNVLSNKIVPGADSTTFTYLGGYLYAKDKNHVYYGYDATVVTGADPTNFGYIDGLYAKDSTHVYFNGKTIAGADPATFRVLQTVRQEASNYGKDKSGGYYAGRIMKAADLKTFSAIFQNAAKDTVHVYQGGDVLENADPTKCSGTNLSSCGLLPPPGNDQGLIGLEKCG